MQHLSDAPRLAIWTDHYNSFHSRTAYSVKTNKNKSVHRSLRSKNSDSALQFLVWKKKLSCKLAINKQFVWQKSWRYCKDVILHASKSCKEFQSGSQRSVATADCTKVRADAKTMHHVKDLQYILCMWQKTQHKYCWCLVCELNFGVPNSSQIAVPRRLRHLRYSLNR